MKFNNQAAPLFVETLTLNGKDLGSQATLTIIAAPSGSQQIGLRWLDINVKQAADIQVLAGATEIDYLFLGATAGKIVSHGDEMIKLGAGNALSIVKPAATWLSWKVKYVLLDV